MKKTKQMEGSFALGGPFSCFVMLGKMHGEGTSVYCLPFTSGSGSALRVSTGLERTNTHTCDFTFHPFTPDNR